MENPIINNKIEGKIKELEVKGFRFMPGRSFFIEIGIGQKRWGQLIRNDKPATIEELERIAKYFDIPLYSLIESQNYMKEIQHF